ncbi:MAG: 4-hydroxythreonine-4-phosphate dehydrogenase PdxA [Verrucomicrobia bacterium]|nr:4-hydroxythreonine-4-phosphate dehydrogenase PdxA [Verrucomicrobiota bacterium]
MRKKRLLIGVTLGDPAGVGPELIKKALRKIGNSIPIEVLGESGSTRSGRPSLVGAQAAKLALEESVHSLKKNRWAAVVNGPVSKEWLQRVGFAFPGQTEFYAKSFGKSENEVTMLMIGPRLRIALVSTHLSLLRAVKGLRKKDIVRSGVHLIGILKRLGFKKPKIAVCGLNPHAGEGGAFGQEEKKIVLPAVRELQKRMRLQISGPESPDTVFWRAYRGEFDGVIALYHDQGLIPAKLLDFDSTVNVTAGLPVVRCAPDHGTAFSLAGRGMAKPHSLIAAIRLAYRLAKNPAK